MIESVYMNGNLVELDEGSKESGVDVTISIDQEPDERICTNCSEAIVEYPSGWVHEQGSRGAIGDPDLCGSIDWMDIAIAVDVDPDEAPEGFLDLRKYSIDQLRDVGYTKAEPRDVPASIGSANSVSAEVSPDGLGVRVDLDRGSTRRGRDAALAGRSGADLSLSAPPRRFDATRPPGPARAGGLSRRVTVPIPRTISHRGDERSSPRPHPERKATP